MTPSPDNQYHPQIQHTTALQVTFPRPEPIKPTRYYGKRDHNVIEEWIASVGSYFVLTNAQPPYIYHYLNTLFAGEAAIWFRYHFPMEVADTLTWETVRESLRAFFMPPRRLLDEWVRSPQTSTQERSMLVDKFIRGLKPKTRIRLELEDPRTLDEAFRLADRYDAILYRRNFNSKIHNYNQPTHEPSYEEGSEPMQIDVLGKEIETLRHQAFTESTVAKTYTRGT